MRESNISALLIGEEPLHSFLLCIIEQCRMIVLNAMTAMTDHLLRDSFIDFEDMP